MAQPQSGIFFAGTPHHLFLEFELDQSCSKLPSDAPVLGAIDGGAQVIGIGGGLFDRIDVPKPDGYSPFTEIQGKDGKVAPATQQDLFVWLHGFYFDELFARGLEWKNAMAEVGSIAHEDYGFKYKDKRDLTGFALGVANPKGDNQQQVATIADGPATGGSYLLTQHWAHDLDGFHSLSVPNQEQVIGRTKSDSNEMFMRPPTSHVARIRFGDSEEYAQIFRRSAPVGGVHEAGLYFLAFCAYQQTFKLMLDSMFGVGDDTSDRLLDFSTPSTGSYYYAPPTEHLVHLS